MTDQAAAIDIGQPAVISDDLEDATLVAEVRAGNAAAFEPLMRRHNRRMFRTARSLVRDDDEAEDIVQEAYVRAWLRLADLTRSAGFTAWVARIALNEARMRLRRSRRVGYPDDEGLDMAATDQSPHSATGADPEALAGRTRMRSNSAVRAATVSWRMFWRVCMANPSGVRSGGFSRIL